MFQCVVSLQYLWNTRRETKSLFWGFQMHVEYI